jgi:hypothetical protein
MDILHVFLDTNILYNDPFFKFQNGCLLDYTGQGKIKLFISSVVLSELMILQKARLKKNIDELKKSYGRLTKISNIELDLDEITRDNLLRNLDEFYKKLSSEGKINIINPSESIFTEILNQCVNKMPPFFENKNEFKDSVIWYNYVDYIKEHKIKNCCLITENTSDFCDKTGHLHPKLKDILDIELYKGSGHFQIETATSLEVFPTEKIILLFESITDKTEFAQHLLISQIDEIDYALDMELLGIDAALTLKQQYPFINIGHISLVTWNMFEVSQIEIEPIDNFLYIKGAVKIKVELNVYERSELDSEMELNATIYPIIRLDLYVRLNEEGKIDFLELDNANIDQI